MIKFWSTTLYINFNTFNLNYIFYIKLIEKFALILVKPELLAPVIIEDTLRHVTRGQTLHVNCTTTVAADLTYGLIWNTPQAVRKQFIYLYPNYTGRFVTGIQLKKMSFYVKKYVENIKQNFFILCFSENWL